MFKCFERLRSPFLLFIRVYWGYLFMAAGYKKFFNIEGTAQFFASLGIKWDWWDSALGGTLGTFSTLNVYAVASAEYVLGLLLMFGLFSRFSALALTVIMSVAYATAHSASVQAFWAAIMDIPNQGFFAISNKAIGLPLLSPEWAASQDFIKESPFSYLGVALIILIFGPGVFALDALLGMRRRRKEAGVEAAPDDE